MASEAKKAMKAVVIGAGLAGLAAAYRLNKNRIDVQVYEARGRVGGRVCSVEVQGHIAELGGQNIRDGNDSKHLLGLAREINIPIDERVFPLGMHYFDQGRVHNVSTAIREKRFDSQTLKTQLETLQRTAQNMEEVLQAVLGKDTLLYKACRLFFSGYEGALPDQLSTYYVQTLHRFLTGGFASSEQQADGEDYAYHAGIRDGNGKLPEKLMEELNGRVHLNQILKKADRDAQGTYRLEFLNGKEVSCDLLILAIPCPTYQNIHFNEECIPHERLKAIRSILYGTNAKILFPVPFQHQNFGIYTNGSVVTFLNQDRHVANLHYVGERGRFNAENLAERMEEERPFAEKVYGCKLQAKPVLSSDRLFAAYNSPVAHSWPNDPYAGGSYSCIGIGQDSLMTSLTEVFGEKVKKLFSPIHSTLFFAGEHTSTLLEVAGTMEAAVESGERTARMVAKARASI